MAPTMNTNGSSSSFVWGVQKATQSANGEQDISHARGRSDSNNRFWQDVHFISLPPFANLDHLGVTNMFDHVWPICSERLTISWIALGDMPVSMFSSYFVVNALQPKRGPKRISTGFQTRSHDSNMSDQKQKHNNMEVPYPSWQNNKTLVKSIYSI